MIYQDFLLRIIVTFALSFAIGLERQWRRRVIGLRTNVLVCLGAFLFVSFSFLTDAKDVSRISFPSSVWYRFFRSWSYLKR